jgi:hypothetical protein
MEPLYVHPSLFKKAGKKFVKVNYRKIQRNKIVGV